MEVTHSIERKQIKAIHTIKLQIQQKIEAIHTIKLQIQQTTLLTHCFVLITTSKCGIEDS